MAYPTNGGKPVFREFITPIGLLVHCSHDKPMARTDERTKRAILDDAGLPEAEYRVTMAWPKANAIILQPLIDLAQMVKAEAWPESVRPGAFFNLEPFFRDGDNPAHNTKKREYLFNHYYLNFKQKAQATRHPVTGQIIYSGAPGIVGPNMEDIMPLDIYSGCTGKASGIMFGSEYMGKCFISTRLNNIQKAADGERIGNVRPDAKSQFTPIAGATGTLQNVL